MKLFHFSSIVLLGTIAGRALAQERPPVSDDLKVIDKRLVNYWAQSTCIKRGDGSEQNMKEQCKKVCFPNPDPNKMSASTCWFGDAKWLDGSSGKPLADQNKNIPGTALKGGYCGCDDPIILFAADFFLKAVIEMGKIIEKVVCPALQALDIVIEFGSLAIPPPGKAIQGGMIAAVKTAKAYKYAYEAQDAAQEWANMIFGGLSLSKEAGCGEPPFSLAKLVAKFLDFANVPDATLPGGLDYKSLPCPKGGCKGTRQGEKPEEKPKTDTPAKTSAPPSKSTAASSSFKPSATAAANCKVLGEKLENAQPAEKRGLTDTLHGRRLQKRRPKSGVACIKLLGEWKISSFDYPSNPGNPDAKSAKELGFDSLAYGWSDAKSCDDYEWGHAFFNGQDKYDTEHILEWSVITNFFTTLDGQFKQDEFIHPDPNQKGRKINFCSYWKESWEFTDLQAIDNPAPQSGAKTKFTQLKPVEWIAANYPYKDRDGGDFLNELTLLQKVINSPAKNNMFGAEPIYNDGDMQKYIKRTMNNVQQQDSPRIAIQRIRSVVGAFKYMQEKEIAKIFKDEKVRIGVVLDGIDKNLPKTPRMAGSTKYTPWKTLGLGAKWDVYMDGVFKNAKDKGTTFVEDNIKRLKDEYTSQKAKDDAKDDPKKTQKERNDIAEWAKLREDIEKIIPKLEAEWNKSRGWSKPW